MTRVLGLDLGMSGARAAVLADDGTVLGRGAAPCTHLHPSGGVAEHDPRAWLDEAATAGRAAVSDAGERNVGGPTVDAIAVAGLGPAPVLVDRELDPLLPAPLFSLDARAESFRTAVAERTGADVGPDHVLPRLLAWRDTDPQVVERAAWVLDATGFVVGWLIGRPVMDRVTAADHVVDGFEAPVAPPPPEDPLAIAGGLVPSAAERLGVDADTPVAVGTYDTFVDVAALPIASGDVAMLLGSTLILGTVAGDGTVAPEGLRTSPHVGPGVFVGGWTSTAGTAIDRVGQLVGGTAGVDPAEVAALEPGSHGLVALPYLAGERAPVWDPYACGVLLGLSLATTAVDVVRAVLDGVALSARDLFERLSPLRSSEPQVWVAGGGTRNGAWLSGTADALGVPLTVARGLRGGVAAARFALRALGLPPPPLDVETVEPDPARHERYLELAAVTEDLYEDLAGRMHRLRRIGRSAGPDGPPMAPGAAR